MKGKLINKYNKDNTTFVCDNISFTDDGFIVFDNLHNFHKRNLKKFVEICDNSLNKPNAFICRLKIGWSLIVVD